MRRLALIVLIFVVSSVQARSAVANSSIAPQPATLIVSPDGPYTRIEDALAQAQDGDTIQVEGGVHPGTLVVGKSVHLQGIGWPVLDAGGSGTVVTLAAPGITFQGFEVRGSGIEPDRDHSGITLTAPDITVKGNRLIDVLFGIFVSRADRAKVVENEITSKAGIELARKGDGIRLWYSQEVQVERNHVYGARDVVMWYSSQVLVRENVIESGRYGVHLMYCDQAQIIANRLANNSVGIYTMYSNQVTLARNDIRHQRGPSGYGLGFKDAKDVLVKDNILVDNGAGIFMDGTPFAPGSYALFESNIIAFNDVGTILLPAVRGASFAGNTFWENIEQVSLQGGGKAGENTWKGNYWSDYSGFDVDEDGFGEIPYLAERFFENLTDREPLLRALTFSPVVQTLELAVASFPIFKPQPKFSDPSPSLLPAQIPAGALSLPTNQEKISVLLVGIGLLAASSLIIMQSNRTTRKSRQENSILQNGSTMFPIPSIVRIQNISKSYGAVKVLDGITLEIRQGESLALWGANGAGKTTLLKALLGLIEYQGEIRIEGFDAHRQGKAARGKIGYVPQEAIFYDLCVQHTMEFYANLKKAPISRIPLLKEQLGLIEHAHKAVPALSGGLKQRLALAIALLSDPPILLLDEPTANLDAKSRREYLALLKGLRENQKTIIFASHRLEEVETLADRVAILDQGKITDELAPTDLRFRIQPAVELVLWVANEQRQRAMEILQRQGLKAHFNGRGTVIAHLSAGQKVRALELLENEGIPVLDFEIEKDRPWN